MRQPGIALKPRLAFRRGGADEDNRAKILASQVNFTIELIILQADQWHRLKEQLSGWYRLLFPDEKYRFDDLIISLETANRST